MASGAGRVALYAMESPQHWFKDFGAGRLENGTAAVALDPTFAETVSGSSDYRVFLTPEGDCRGLYVSRYTASGFEVRELGGGQSTVAFDYRIVAPRRGFENVRLEDVTERWNKINTPVPAPALGQPYTLPSPPPAPRLAESDVAGRDEAQRAEVVKRTVGLLTAPLKPTPGLSGPPIRSSDCRTAGCRKRAKPPERQEPLRKSHYIELTTLNLPKPCP